VGRGVRLTPAGRLLADRAAEIVGRVESASAELSAHVGLSSGRVRLAGFGSAMSSIVPLAARELSSSYPGLELGLTDTHPGHALAMLRAGGVDVALIFRYDDTAPEEDGIRLVHLLDDPVYLLTTGGGRSVRAHRDSPWIGGCERCRAHLVDLCERAGFSPRVVYSSDDMVVIQSLVAAGLGVTTIPGLALAAHPHADITATRLKDPPRRIYAATYGDPPDPPATTALVDAVKRAGGEVVVRGLSGGFAAR